MSVERLAFSSTQNTGFLSSTQQKQNNTHIKLIKGKTMPMRNRTRIIVVSPGVNDVDVGAAQK
jgi:hypothetical protein